MVQNISQPTHTQYVCYERVCCSPINNKTLWAKFQRHAGLLIFALNNYIFLIVTVNKDFVISFTTLVPIPFLFHVDINHVKYYVNIVDINIDYVFYQNTHTEQQTVHAEGNQYTCDVCKRSFALRKAFRRHWLTHRLESQYACDVCDKSFYDKSGLKRHQRLHTEERPFSRRVCNKS